MDHPYYPNALITAEALQSRLDSKELVIVEVDLDPDAFGHGHLPGAIAWDWSKQVRNPKTHEVLTQAEFESLMCASGITQDSTIILYGDNNNWFACWAYWLAKLYGHEKVYVLDGGTMKWISDGRPITLEEAPHEKSEYTACDARFGYKASIENVFESFFSPKTHRLVDVRSAAEFEGRLLGPGIGAEATCSIGGHIPTAINVPWNLNCDESGCFKTREQLEGLYKSFGILPENQIITYCAVGERASLSWFVLHELLGFPCVMNYDRSMAQWCRIANAPIAQGEAA